MASIYEDKSRVLTPILEYDSNYLQLLSEAGKTSLGQFLKFGEQAQTKFPVDTYVLVVRQMLDIVRALAKSQLFCTNLTAESFRFVPLHQFKEYGIRLVASA